MQITVPVQKSFGQLLHDLGFKELCEGKHSYPLYGLDSKIIFNHLIKKQALNFPICANKKDKRGRNFLANPGVFMPPDTYYFFKEANYCPDNETITVRVIILKGNAKKNSGLKLGKGLEKEMTVEEIRSSITVLSGGIFERFYRAVYSVSEAYTICK